jgi:hypothetical protein
MTTWNKLGYREAVKRIASNAIAEYPLEVPLNCVDEMDLAEIETTADERHQFVSESVRMNEYVLNATDAVIQAMETDVCIELDSIWADECIC